MITKKLLIHLSTLIIHHQSLYFLTPKILVWWSTLLTYLDWKPYLTNFLHNITDGAPTHSSYVEGFEISSIYTQNIKGLPNKYLTRSPKMKHLKSHYTNFQYKILV